MIIQLHYFYNHMLVKTISILKKLDKLEMNNELKIKLLEFMKTNK